MPQGIEAQTECSLKNVQAILEAGGSSMDKVIKTTVFLKDMGDFGAMNGVYARFFSEGAYPSRTRWRSPAPQGRLVEIEAIAWVE